MADPMHIAEHTGLVGDTLRIKRCDGVVFVGELRAECEKYLYFLGVQVQQPGGPLLPEASAKIHKGEIAELEVYPF